MIYLIFVQYIVQI